MHCRYDEEDCIFDVAMAYEHATEAYRIFFDLYTDTSSSIVTHCLSLRCTVACDLAEVCYSN